VIVTVLVLTLTVVLGVSVVVDSVVIAGGMVSGIIVTVCVGGTITADGIVVVVVLVLPVLGEPDASLTIAQISTTNNSATTTPVMNRAAGLRYHGTGGS
jgi:hypothetical protein